MITRTLSILVDGQPVTGFNHVRLTGADSIGLEPITDRVVEKIWEAFGVEISQDETKLVKKVSTKDLEIYIQSPLGGNITPEEVAAKLPEGTEACFVRVDQNKIWWVRGDGETGYVWIWD